MTMANADGKEDGEESSLDCNELDIDAIWSKFRLPVPLVAIPKGKRQASSTCPNPDDDDDGDAALDAWLIQALDLLRLIHKMNERHSDPERRPKASVARGQVKLARILLDRVQRGASSSQPDNADAAQRDDDDEKFRRNRSRLVQKLAHDTNDACSRLQRWLDGQDSVVPERDIIHDIFLAPPPPPEEDDDRDAVADGDTDLPPDDFEDDEMEIDDDDDCGANAGGGADLGQKNARSSAAAPPARSQRHQSQRSHRPQPTPGRGDNGKIDPVELQRQQQELLEAELASMAARLKSSTMAMNSTLQTQTRDLDEMEQLAQNTLDQVADTTKKVEDRLARKKGWKKKLATWSLVGTVIGTWTLCFMIMRVRPKRRDVGPMRLFDKVRSGGASAWKMSKRLYTEVEKSYYNSFLGRIFEVEDDPDYDDYIDEDPEWLVRKKERERKREERRRQKEEERQRRRQPRQAREQQQEERGGCEVLADGTQVCTEEDRMEAKAREMAAERRRDRLSKNMENAPVVDAVDVAHADEGAGEEIEAGEVPKDDGGDPLGCVPPTDGMAVREKAMASLSEELRAIERDLGKAPVGSEGHVRLSEQGVNVRAELNHQARILSVEQNKARSAYWESEDVRRKSRALKRALGSIQFCDNGQDAMMQPKVEGEFEEQKRREGRAAKAYEEVQLAKEREAKQLQEEKAREEDEIRRRVEEEKTRQEEARRSKQAEIERLEQERIERERILAAEREKLRLEAARVEAEKKAEMERLERELAEQQRRKEEEAEARRLEEERRQKEKEEARRIAEENAKRHAQERLAERQAELKRLDEERVERQRIIEQQRRDEKKEAYRLEQARVQAETARKEEEANRISNAKAKAAAEAQQAIELSKAIAADNTQFLPSDIRSAAGRLKNDLLAHYISSSPGMIDAPDRNGWRPIHEAARAGNLAGIQLLASAGCDVSSRTGRTGQGGTALWWAIQRFGEDSDVVRLLRSYDAKDDGPATE